MSEVSNTPSVLLSDPDVTLWHGDALRTLRLLPDHFVDMCATSPPFYGLRDYDVDGQIGLERSPHEYLERLREVFSEVRRVLRPAGTCWIEMGDSYGNKSLIGAPWSLALGLRDLWYLRGCYIWAKPDSTPESVTDRCTTAHSYIFHLSRNANYYFDAEAIREPNTPESLMDAARRRTPVGRTQGNGATSRGTGRGAVRMSDIGDGRNARSVWTISTSRFTGAHFATWPTELARRIILAGCPENGVVLDPFAGSGTTLAVARKLGRKAIGIELNESYCQIASERLAQQVLELSA